MHQKKYGAIVGIERTITDIRRTPSTTLGAGLQKVYLTPKTKNIGYELLIAMAAVQNLPATSFKWLYLILIITLTGKSLSILLIIERLNWQPGYSIMTARC